MVRSPLLFLVLLLAANTVRAQPEPVEPPLVGRPPDFSGIVGQYEISASASPTEVQIEQPITLRIFITGHGPELHEPRRELLRIFPEDWDNKFYIDEVREEHRVNRAEMTWLFVYRLRPKHTNIDAIDGIKLVYYDPQSRQKKKFITRFVEDRIAISVLPATTSVPDIPIDQSLVPESFFFSFPLHDFERPSEAQVLDPVRTVAFLSLFPLACCLVGYAWRKTHPDELARRRRQRGLAAERALSQLRANAAPVWDILEEYLRVRFDLSAREPMPITIKEHLYRRGFARDLCARWDGLLKSCDALRFAQTRPSEAQALGGTAADLIADLEADPCAH